MSCPKSSSKDTRLSWRQILTREEFISRYTPLPFQRNHNFTTYWSPVGLVYPSLILLLINIFSSYFSFDLLPPLERTFSAETLSARGPGFRGLLRLVRLQRKFLRLRTGKPRFCARLPAETLHGNLQHPLTVTYSSTV